jgi:hypothetical protein
MGRISDEWGGSAIRNVADSLHSRASPHTVRVPSLLMVPTLRVVTHPMTLCVIRDVAHAVRLCGLKKLTDTTALRTIESPTGVCQPQNYR